MEGHLADNHLGWIAALTIVAYGGFRVLVWLDQGILG